MHGIFGAMEWMGKWRVVWPERRMNVVGMRGGKFLVPDKDYDEFLELVMRKSESEELFLVEQGGAASRMFVDYDAPLPPTRVNFAMERSEALVERLTNEVCAWMGEVHTPLVKWREGSASFHMVFPSLTLTRQGRKVLTTHLHAVDGGVDLKASGLRLPGSWGAKGQPPYGPLHADFSIHAGAEVPVSHLPHVRHTAMRNGSKLFMPATVSDELLVPVRKYRAEWRGLQIDQQKEDVKRGVAWVTVKGPGKTFCLMHGGAHASNRVRFKFYDNGAIEQLCFKCKGSQFIRV